MSHLAVLYFGAVITLVMIAVAWCRTSTATITQRVSSRAFWALF
jgi:hypothetical protein